VTRPTLTPERWARVQEVLLDALEHEGAAREGVVARACAGDPALESDVRSLIAAHEAESLLPDTVEAPAAEPATLQWVGPYQLLRELGRGGMGTVYLAERAGDGFTQRVALKLMRPDYADPRIIAAISAERRILARLEHPGIARFIDGGTTGSGQPFIAMEYVDGTALPQHADAAGLGVRERVALMMDVCAAVQYAHRQLVVHRDLKPGNILVTADGTTKLLDFGIATMLDDPAREPGRDTALWLTPAYASPEQLRRQPVTTLTDVYALGVVLYELLAGRSPYDFGDGSLHAITSAICDRMPEPPSVAVQRAGRPAWARAIGGDLDQVVLRALAKEPNERYGSVEQLCEDLQHWRDHLPVRAGPDSVGRRVRRFARRHRNLVATAAVTFVALVAGLSTTLWQARRARMERDRAQQALARSEEVSHFLLGLIESADPRRVSGDTTTGRAILRLGLDRVEELRGQPIVQADVLDALGRVLGSIGQHERASELHARALGLRRGALGVRHPDVAPSLVALGGSLLRRSQYDEAEARYREALALQEAAYGHDDPRVAGTLMELAFLMPYRGREVEAESLYAVARDVFTRTVGPDDRRTLMARQKLTARIRLRDLATGEAQMHQLVDDARRALGEEDPFTANCMFHLGDYIRLQRPEDPEAEQWYRDGIARIERRLGERHIDLIHGLNSLTMVRVRRGDFSEAEVLVRRSIAINEASLGADHAGTAGSVAMLAWLYERRGRLEQAEAARRDALGRLERALGADHGEVAQARADLAKLAYRRGEVEEAEQLWRQAIDDMLRAFGPEHAAVLRGKMQLAAVLSKTGRPDEVTRLCAEGVAGINRTIPRDHTVQREARAESPHCNWNGADP
jgi:tetratricopeptide (TPR) repeat protein/predicted Ser/Thr protein kinase